MKSRKNVSRKKMARHKTSMRRNSRRTHSGRRRFTRIKRGGMMRLARTLLYHDILPLLSKAKVTINIGRDPTPDEHAITKENERVYETILGIPVDDGIKESIKNLREELENPVKTADKWSSILKAHHTIIKKLEEEKKKQLAKQATGLMVVGTSAFTPNHKETAIKASFLKVGPGAASGAGAASSSDSPFNEFINPPLTFSPNPERYPDYSTKTTEPKNPDDKSKFKPKPAEQLDYGTPPRNPFDNGELPINSPYFSPPPPDQSANLENENPQLLLSPGPEVRKLRF